MTAACRVPRCEPTPPVALVPRHANRRSEPSPQVALNIKDPETDRLARELAELSGLPITTAVRDAIQERLTILRARSRTTPPGLEEIITRGRARATVDARSEDEILGYDTRGLPG